MASKKIQVSEVVGMFLDTSDFGNAEYSKAYRIAIRGWRQLQWDVSGTMKTTRLLVMSNLTADLPDDCLSIDKIGVGGNGGELALLTRNDNITATCDLEEEYERTIYPPEGNDINIYPHSGRSLGVGSINNIGEYALQGNKVILSPSFCYSELILVYMSSSTPDGEYLIDEMGSEALLAYIRWQWYVAKNIAQSQKEAYRRDWFNELRLYKRRKQGLTEALLNDASRLSVKYAIKS